jgi:hypothetical protein
MSVCVCEHGVNGSSGGNILCQNNRGKRKQFWSRVWIDKEMENVVFSSSVRGDTLTAGEE